MYNKARYLRKKYGNDTEAIQKHIAEQQLRREMEQITRDVLTKYRATEEFGELLARTCLSKVVRDK